MLKYLLPITLLLSFMQLAQAHDPGLSRANIQLRETGMTLHMVFARKDIEVLVPMDANHDGAVTADEVLAARTSLKSPIMAAVEVRGAKKKHQPKLVRIKPTPGDAVNIELHYEYREAREVGVHVPLIAQLARGHRQYLTVQDAEGNLLAQHILAASSTPILLQESGSNVFGVFHQYLLEGIWHIWIGFDHILFLLTLLLPAVLVYRKPRWQSQDSLRPAMTDILKVVTAFTVAHSITLALAVLDIVTLPPRLVESVIALSVLITAVNNLRPVFPASRWLLAFAFGLVHGFGFASVLVDLGLPGNAIVISLLGFNLGVEAGQLAIVALVFPLTALIRHTSMYRTWVFSGGSLAAALIATIWMFERIFDYEVLGF